MRYLEKIAISNIRKFAENVEIPIGKGATVFLAPNGTGKTAIFEAIELALTGEVRRLPTPPNALIRDNKLKSFIRLDFEDGKFCEADFAKGKKPVLKGSHADLFGAIPSSEIPFLLRLTHLLNQKNTEWFVQTHGTAAGEQLDHLSIGRDAAQANTLMTSAKKAANAAVDASKNALDEAIRTQDRWVELKNLRTATSSEIKKNLESRVALLAKINKLGGDLNVTNITSDEVNVLSGQIDLLEGLVKRARDTSRSQLSDLTNLDKTITDFLERTQSIEKATAQLDITKGSKKQLADEIASLRERFLRISNDIRSQEDVLLRFQTLKDLQETRSKTVANMQRIVTEIETKNREIESLAPQIQSLKDNLEQAHKVARIFDLIRERTQELIQERALLQVNEKLIVEWEHNIDALKQLKDQQPSLINQSTESQKQLDEFENLQQLAKVAMEHVQSLFDSLNSTSDAIKEAIGHIASHLPEDTDDCPVCLQHYEKGELRLRIAKALENISPLLQETASRLEAEKSKLQIASANLKMGSESLRQAQLAMQRNSSAIAEIEQTISSKFLLKIYGCGNVDDAKKKRGEVQEKIAKADSEILELRNAKQRHSCATHSKATSGIDESVGRIK
jgi:DNA repair protein SbcC/Rad50